MFKLTAHIILILSVLLSQWYNSLVALNYQVNYNYYTEVLCENQDEPELHCNGQCAFSKQMQLGQEEPADTEPPVLLPTLRLFSHACQAVNFNPEPTAKLKFNSFNQHLPGSPYLPVAAHPPKV